MRILQYKLEKTFGIPVEVSEIKNKKLGDFSTNVLMQHNLKMEDFDLNAALFKRWEVTRGYLNLFVSEQLLPLVELPVIRKCEHRIYDVYHRLLQEGYVGESTLNVWSELAKAYNLLNITMEEFDFVTEEEVTYLLGTFNRLDDGFVYRRQSKETLIGIYHVLKHCIRLLERVKYEKHL